MNPWKGLKGLPRDLWLISFATLINRAGTMVLPFLAIYLISELDFEASSAGFVITFFGIGGLITAPFVGKLADKIGAFKLMKISLFATGFVLLLYPFFFTYLAIIIITFTWSVVSEAFRPAALALVSEIVPAENRKTAFALNRLMINLGMSIGPVAAGFLVLIDFSIIFYFDAATSFLSGLFLLLYPIKPVYHHDEKIKETDTKSIKKSVLKDSFYIYFLIAILPASMVIFQHIGAMPIFLVNDLLFNPSTVGFLFAVNTVLIILVEVPLNSAMSHWSDKKSLVLGAFLVGAGFGAMAFAEDIYAIILTIIIWTFGEMIFFPSSSSFTAEISPPGRRGEYMGYYQLIFSLAFAMGPWLGTEIYETFGANILWIITFFTGVISALLLYNLKEKPPAKSAEQVFDGVTDLTPEI